MRFCTSIDKLLGPYHYFLETLRQNLHKITHKRKKSLKKCVLDLNFGFHFCLGMALCLKNFEKPLHTSVLTYSYTGSRNQESETKPESLTMAGDQPGGLAGRSAGSGDIQLSLAGTIVISNNV
jgi:hypothetical protein